MAEPTSAGRHNQRARTERALIDACQALMRSGGQVTMPEVARTALVSEATAYRYFPDLATLLARSLDKDWATPEEALAAVATSGDPVERVVHATRFLLEGVAQRQWVVRTVIANTVTQPESVRRSRPGLRFGLIDEALRPFAGRIDPANEEQLRRDLAVVVSAETLFTLTDLVGLDVDDAIESACKTAGTITRAAFNPPKPPRSRPQRTRAQPTTRNDNKDSSPCQ
jgi:AcrR family transcriptional regulator